MSSTASLEVRIGLLVVAAVAATVVLILASDRISFDGSYRVTVYLQDAGGLNVGSPVKLSGIPVGSVQAIAPTRDPRGPIKAAIQISERYRISESARFELSSSGIFGDSFISIIPPSGPDGGELPVDDSAEVVASRAFIARATTQAQDIIDGLADLLDEQTRGEVERLVSGGADLVDEGTSLVRELRASVAQLDTVVADVGGLVDELRATQRDLGARARHDLEQLDLTLRQVRESAAAASARIDEVSGSATELMQRGSALAAHGSDLLSATDQDIVALLAHLDGLARRLRGTVDDLRAGRGVLGQLLVNDALAKDLNDTVITAQQLTERVSDHPEILVWGTSDEERDAARRARARRKLRRAFMEGYDLNPPVEVVSEEAAIAEEAADDEPPAEEAVAEGR